MTGVVMADGPTAKGDPDAVLISQDGASRPQRRPRPLLHSDPVESGAGRPRAPKGARLPDDAVSRRGGPRGEPHPVAGRRSAASRRAARAAHRRAADTAAGSRGGVTPAARYPPVTRFRVN